MNSLLELKEGLKLFYAKYDSYLVSFLKFLLALLTFIVVNTGLGQMDQINSLFFVLIAALCCSFLPSNAIVLISSGMIILHLYALSLDAFLVGTGLLIVVLLLHFGTAPREAFAFILTPIAFALKVPCLVPLAFGLAGTPMSAVGAGLGTIVYYSIRILGGGTSQIEGLSKDAAEAMIQKITWYLDQILKNPTIVIMVITMAAVLIAVYCIKRMEIRHSWTLAIILGGVIFLTVSALGELIMGSVDGVLTLTIGTVLSVAVSFVVKFFCFHVDYKKTEKVQFEDDDYYYYVTAVPKIAVKPEEAQAVKKRPSVNRQNVQARQPRRDRGDGESDLDIRDY